MSVNHIGSKLAIATGKPATLDAAGFAALTWVEAPEGTVSIGAIGDTNETITVPDLTTGRNMTLKGAKTGDTVNVALSMKRVLATGALTASQLAFKAAAQAASGEYSYRVTELGTGGVVQYICGAPMNWKTNERSTTSYAGFSFDVAINYDPVDVYPAFS